MRRRRRRRKNTRRASNKDSEIFAGQLFSCPVFSREDEDRRRRPRSARECSKTHSVLSPLSPGSNFIFTQVSGSGLPVFFIQNFYCYRKTAALLHASRAQKGGCLTIPDLLPVPGRKIHHIPLKCLRKEEVSGHMRRDHEVSEVPERTVRRKRFRLRHIESAAAEMSLF